MCAQNIKPGTTVKTASGELVKVGEKFNAGGQGSVAHAEYRGKPVVLKVWHNDCVTNAQLQQLAKNCTLPSPSHHFAWPIAVVVDGLGNAIGYIMPFVGGKNYDELKDRLFGECDTTYWALSSATIDLTTSMIALHSEGLVYGDLNYGNVKFHRKRGNVLLCDMDNATFDGVDIGLIYSYGCAPPSLIMKLSLPSIKADQFALASLTYSFLTAGIPMEGRLAAKACALSRKELEKLHGKNALFSFHPTDDRNRPCPVMQAGVEDSWKQLPSNIRDMYTQTFTDGLHDHTARFRETTWREALVGLRDSIVVCRCGAHVFTEPGTEGVCWNCKKNVKVRRELAIDGRRLVLNRGSGVFPHHASKGKRGDFSNPLGTVVSHEQNKKVWGLRNDSKDTWSVVTPDGQVRQVPPNQVAPLARGNKVAFADSEAVVR